MGEKVRRLRSTNRQLQNSQGDISYDTGNEVAKQLTCLAHGHEQWCEECLSELGGWVERGKGGKIGTTVIA